MKESSKKGLIWILCFFFLFSSFGGGLFAFENWGGASLSFADDESADATGETVSGDTVDDSDAAESVPDHSAGLQEPPKVIGGLEDSSMTLGMSLDAFLSTGRNRDGADAGKMKAAADGEEETPAPAVKTEVINGLTIEGGAKGTDFTVSADNTYIQILTSRPLTLSGSTTTNIRVGQGVTANLTLKGVNITKANNDSPINLWGAGAACNITLASGTTNQVKCTGVAAAIHCGEGSSLTIKGDRTSVLKAYGGPDSAAIGAGPAETAGTMTFESGYIEAYSFGGLNTNSNTASNSGSSSCGTGIGAGGGSGGGGNMTFHNAEVHAYGSYHGAGIGAGWSSGSTAKQQGASTNTMTKTCGNITINGGYITSRGYEHGGAFGGACGTSAAGCTIRVTGGTLLPSSSSGQYDFNGSNGEVYIEGGSVRSASTSKFMSKWGAGVAHDKNGGAVFMVTIDLAGAEGDEILEADISDWYVTIAGSEYAYGAPSRFDQGKLYLWVPAEAKGKNVSVSCKYSYIDETTDETVTKQLNPLYIEGADGGGTSVLKRYIDFKLPETYVANLTKDYDGTAFASYDLEEKGKSITAPDGRVLDKNEFVEIIVQRHDKINGTPIEEEHSTGGGNKMPSDAGIYKFTLISKQYANADGFKESYWGHRATGWAVINKIPSKVDAQYAIKVEERDGKLVITNIQVADSVQPGDDKSPNYELPDGKLQFYINGVKVGAEIDLKEWKDKDEKDKVLTIFDGYEIGGEGNIRVPELDSGEFKVTAVYSGGTNYLDSTVDATLVPWNVIKDPDQKDPPPTPSIDTIVNTFPFINPPVPTISNMDPDKIDPDQPIDGNKLVLDKWERIDQDSGDPESWPMHGFFKDRINQKVKKDEKVTISQLKDLINDRYIFTTKKGVPLYVKNDKGEDVLVKAAETDIKILDKDGNDITEEVKKNGGIDLSEPGKYTVSVTVTDASGNQSTIDIAYNVTKPMILDPDLNKDTNDDGIPDINIDTDDDGLPDINIDTDGDDKPDINVDTDGDGKPDVDIDTDGDGKPDVNKDTDGDGKPDLDIDKDGDGKPDVNVDTDGDGKPDLNKDTDGDGKPDVDIDTDGDGKPDLNKDTNGDGKPDLDIDKDGDGKPDLNVDTDGDGKPDLNIDKNGDGKPDLNIDKDGDGKPDLNVDTDGDGKPDLNIDKNGDGKPDVDIDTDGDGKPDLNVDTDGDGKPDLNIDKNGDGKPDLNIDTDGDGKPDLNVDTDGDGIPDLNVDTDGDGIPDTNVDTDGDGKPDQNIKTPEEIKNILKENEPVDTDELPWWIPKTGDTANMIVWIAALAAAVLAFGAAVFGMRKKTNAK